jgi:hypothetical protein
MPPPPKSPPFFVKYTLVVYVVFCIYVGGALLIMPWVSWIWENNYFLFRFPSAKPLVLSPFFRGAVSGLGLLTILIGIEEILSYRRWKRGHPEN